MSFANYNILFITVFICSFLGSLIINANSQVIEVTPPLIRINQGRLQGAVQFTSSKNVLFYSFQGIPYALPPVNKLRFREPQPARKWFGVRFALNEGPMCLQPGLPFPKGKEDCLYLNVYTPKLPSKNHHDLKPVMVWIHGGDFIGGSGNSDVYGPDYFIENDVVIITFNYRLGVFGFLSTSDDSIPANNGLRDQIQALKWVNENVEKFGGDPKRITIFGESAGAASVHYLLLSPLTEGLFHGAIAESGTALVRWSLTRNPREIAFETGSLLGIHTNNSQELIDKLRNVNAVKLLTQSYLSILKVRFNPLDGIPYTPCIENDEAGSVVPEGAHQMLASGRFHRVPFLAGYNSREGIFILAVFRYDFLIKPFLANPEFFVPKDLNIPKDSDEMNEVAESIINYYFPNTSTSLAENTVDLITDEDFINPIRQTVKIQAQFYPQTYLYCFSYDGLLGVLEPGLHINVTGVGHGDELGYLWDGEAKTDNEEALLIRERMVKMWTNFAKTGHPTPVRDPLLEFVSWPTVYSGNNDNIHYLDIGKHLISKINPNKQQMAFWEELYKKHGHPPNPTSTRQLILGKVRRPALNATNDDNVHMLNIDEDGELIPQTNPFAEQIKYWDVLHTIFGEPEYL